MHVKELFDLTGQVAIVTGGGRGLGEQFATGLAEAGAHVIVCSRKLESCESVSEKIKELGVESLAIQCDIRNQEDVKNVVDTVIAQFGKIDIVVNNSGATWGSKVEEMPLEAWQKVLQTNVTGTFLMAQEAGKHMIHAKKGKIINIASVAGFGGSHPEYMNSIGYNTSKGAVITFTKDLAVKWGQHNIQVNAIAPGFFPTKMAAMTMREGRDYFLEQTPLKRFGTDVDLKGAAVFLASRASDYVTGDVLVVDGGLLAT